MPTELLLLVLSGLAAGAFGAMLGLGGGILIVPILTLGFGAAAERRRRDQPGVRDRHLDRGCSRERAGRPRGRAAGVDARAPGPSSAR